MDSMASELEDTISELQELATRRPLKGEDNARARELMTILRQMGFTNKEISALTKGAWSETHIRQTYTRGVVPLDTSARDRAIGLLAELVSTQCTLDDVEEYLPVKADLDDRGVGADEVGSFLQTVEESGLPTEEVVQFPIDLREAKVSVAQVSSVLKYKADLDGLGFTIDSLGTIAEAAGKLGSPAEVLKAVNVYNTLSALESEVQERGSTKKSLDEQIEATTTRLTGLRSEQGEVQESLDLVAHLEEEGFDEPTLDRLAGLSAKFGGVKNVFNAFNGYTNLDQINSLIKEAQARLRKLETDVKAGEAEFAYISPVVKTVEILIHKFKFSRDSIVRLYRVAKLHGNPVEVFDALGKLGDMKALEERKRGLSASIAEHEARVEELEVQIQELRGVMDEIKKTTTGILGPFAVEVKKAIDSVATTHRELAERLGGLKAEVEALGEPVKLAKVILSVDRFPTTAKDLPRDYPLLLATGLTKICIVKGINPKRYPGRIMYEKYSIGRDTEFELLDLLNWVVISLLQELGKT